VRDDEVWVVRPEFLTVMEAAFYGCPCGGVERNGMATATERDRAPLAVDVGHL
jgi:hypothetical protein